MADDKHQNEKKDEKRNTDEHNEWGSKEDVLRKLETNLEQGLTSGEAEQRLQKYGRNELTEKKKNPVLQYLGFMWNPLTILAVILGDYLDFGLIIGLLIMNATLGYYEERGAKNAIQALKEQLAPEANVLRDGAWKSIPAAELVPGDVVKINMGDIVSADAYVYEEVNLKVDQAALTGESLPVSKKIGDEVYSGSAVKQGQLHGIVTETGERTFFGRAATLVQGVNEQGHFQKVLRAIGAFCISFIVFFVVIEIIVQFAARHKPCGFPHKCYTLNNAVLLIVGGVPIAMPTVLSVTLAIGASQLSKRKAIVSRLTAVEELAGMDVLCSDKTGTLTKNELTLDPPVTFGKFKANDVILAAALASETVSQDAIDKAVLGQLRDEMKTEQLHTKIVKHQPFDAYTKRSFSLVTGSDGNERWVTKGAPQVILALCKADKQHAEKYKTAVDDFGKRGFRTLGVAESQGTSEDNYRLMGLLPMLDPPRFDTAETIVRTKRQGIKVKMITGDQEAIAKELARRLEMGDNISPLPREKAGEPVAESTLLGIVEDADGFAQVLPEDKYNIVSALQSLGHTVAMTGDGVNDAPALKKADVGVAVAGATSAARAAADIVLTAPGLSTIVAAIIGARIIFQRMKNYSAYAVSVTVRLVLTFFVLTVAYDFYYPTVVLVILAVANDGSMLALSKDRVMPSKRPDSWRLSWLFLYAGMIGSWLAISTIVMFTLVKKVHNFHDWFGLRQLNDGTELCVTSFSSDNPLLFLVHVSHPKELRGLIWIQVSVTGLGAVFSIRTRKWVWDSPPGILLVAAFVLSQILSTVLGVATDREYNGLCCFLFNILAIVSLTFPYRYGLRGYPDSTRGVRGCGWGWALFAWIYSFLWLLPLDLIKLLHRKLQFHLENTKAAQRLRDYKANRRKEKMRKHAEELKKKAAEVAEKNAPKSKKKDAEEKPKSDAHREKEEQKMADNAPNELANNNEAPPADKAAEHKKHSHHKHHHADV